LIQNGSCAGTDAMIAEIPQCASATPSAPPAGRRTWTDLLGYRSDETGLTGCDRGIPEESRRSATLVQ